MTRAVGEIQLTEISEIWYKLYVNKKDHLEGWGEEEVDHYFRNIFEGSEQWFSIKVTFCPLILF